MLPEYWFASKFSVYSIAVTVSICLGLTNAKLKMKNEKSCSRQGDSQSRAPSLFIMESILKKLDGKILKECFTTCHDMSTCQYFAHHDGTRLCLLFKSLPGKEAISRLISQGWKVGRTKTNKKLYLYYEKTNCGESFCQNSCLKDVEEKCPPPYSGTNCDYYAEATTCANLQATFDANPPQGLDGLEPYKIIANVWYWLNIDGVREWRKCSPNLEYDYTTIRPTQNTNLYISSYYENPMVFRAKKDINKWNVFKFNPNTGEIIDCCSSRRVCPLYGNTYDGTYLYTGYHDTWIYLLYYNHCPANTIYRRYKRTGFKSLQYGNAGCLTPNNHLTYLKSNCITSQFIMPEMPPGKVKVSYYNYANILTDLLTASDFPNNPWHVGKVDNFEAATNIKEFYCIRMQSYFVAPQTGSYKFSSNVDDNAFIYLSTTESENEKVEIIHHRGPTALYDYNAYSSISINLVAGRKYYIELIGREATSFDFFSVKVVFPDGTDSTPIVNNYLSNFE